MPSHVKSSKAFAALVCFFSTVLLTGQPVCGFQEALARLAQRLLQEEVDARLSVSGPFALLVVRVPLSRAKPRESLAGTVVAMQEFATGLHRPERLRQATELWLGARVVRASLDGEDWTSLWSESLDLADGDEDLRRALANDADLMLSMDSETLKSFTERWFAPRNGEAGWAWVVAGADPETLERLGEDLTIR